MIVSGPVAARELLSWKIIPEELDASPVQSELIIRHGIHRDYAATDRIATMLWIICEQLAALRLELPFQVSPEWANAIRTVTTAPPDVGPLRANFSRNDVGGAVAVVLNDALDVALADMMLTHRVMRLHVTSDMHAPIALNGAVRVVSSAPIIARLRNPMSARGEIATAIGASHLYGFGQLITFFSSEESGGLSRSALNFATSVSGLSLLEPLAELPFLTKLYALVELGMPLQICCHHLRRYVMSSRSAAGKVGALLADEDVHDPVLNMSVGIARLDGVKAVPPETELGSMYENWKRLWQVLGSNYVRRPPGIVAARAARVEPLPRIGTPHLANNATYDVVRADLEQSIYEAPLAPP